MKSQSTGPGDGRGKKKIKRPALSEYSLDLPNYLLNDQGTVKKSKNSPPKKKKDEDDEPPAPQVKRHPPVYSNSSPYGIAAKMLMDQIREEKKKRDGQ
jgi:hypothetical protein